MAVLSLSATPRSRSGPATVRKSLHTIMSLEQSGKARADDDTKPGYLPISTSPSVFADFRGRYLRAMGRGFCRYLMTKHLRLYFICRFFFSQKAIRLNQSWSRGGFFH